MQPKRKSQQAFAAFIEEINKMILNVFLNKNFKYRNTKIKNQYNPEEKKY